MVSGATPGPLWPSSWVYYYSMIGVREGGPGGIGPALMNTWATWDNSTANAARLRQTLATIASTRVTPIDPTVFDRLHQDWVDYIRM
jgi:hypothetical protein